MAGRVSGGAKAGWHQRRTKPCFFVPQAMHRVKARPQPLPQSCPGKLEGAAYSAPTFVLYALGGAALVVLQHLDGHVQPCAARPAGVWAGGEAPRLVWPALAHRQGRGAARQHQPRAATNQRGAAERVAMQLLMAGKA